MRKQLKNAQYRQGLSNNTLYFLSGLPSAGPKQYSARPISKVERKTPGGKTTVRYRFAHTSEPLS